MTPFAEVILNPERPAPVGLVGPDGQQTSKRFDVYRNNVTVSLREALAVGFPAVAKLLGEENFNGLATAFLRARLAESSYSVVFDSSRYQSQYSPQTNW